MPNSKKLKTQSWVPRPTMCVLYIHTAPLRADWFPAGFQLESNLVSALSRSCVCYNSGKQKIKNLLWRNHTSYILQWIGTAQALRPLQFLLPVFITLVSAFFKIPTVLQIHRSERQLFEFPLKYKFFSLCLQSLLSSDILYILGFSCLQQLLDSHWHLPGKSVSYEEK